METNNWQPKVMVVDDEESIRLAVERILTRLDCRVVTAADGQECLELLGQEGADIVLLDLKMPGMDGMEVHQRIREQDDSILVIIITGYATIETAIEAMKQGAYDFIPKPFEAEQLRIVIKRALDKLHLTRETKRLEEERRRTLFDLATEKSRTRSIVEAMPNGVMVTNSQGQVVLMNQTVREQLALDEDCEIGQSMDSYIPDQELCAFVCNLGSRDDDGQVSTYEMNMGQEVTLLVKARPIHGDDGGHLGSVVVFVDISAIRKLDRLKSEFVAKVSHELRSPLSTIHEQMAMVIQDLLEQEGLIHDQRILSRVQERTKGLINLVEDLLDLSRLEAGAAYQQVQDVHVEEILPQLVDYLWDQAKEKKQELNLSLPQGSLDPVQADAKALESVFNNVISNALKYTPEEGRVDVTLEADQPGWLTLRVADTGYGIDESEQARIFERFYRVKNEKTRFITGSGLGLPIVKGILDDLGGSIHVHSKKGEGSTFVITLPTGERGQEE
ncbi:MAG: response regulator [Desulfovermiculus sp.]|nr:response regulator [Desulfovermiculus sp.]